MDTLTRRQQEILALIRQSLADTGMPPTRAEIAAHFGFSSPNAAEQHLRSLAKKGVIELVAGVSRGIRLLEEQGIPVIGRVAAGSPMLAVENVERHLPLDPGLFSPRADYLLRVSGMSMRDAGIIDGDLLAVHRTAVARHGQVVVARLDDAVTVKRLELADGRIRLLPENPDFSPIEVTGELAIEGLAVGVLRLDGLDRPA